MPKQMTRADALAALEAVRSAMHEQHPANTPRLDQLDAHIATSAMVVEHLYDEAERMFG